MEEMMNMLIRHKLTPNQFYLMWAIEDGVTTPLINVKLEIRNLKNKGYMLDDGKLTDKAKRIVKEIDGFFKRKKKKTDKAIMGDDFEQNITIYNELFPKKKLNTGKYARSSEKNLAVAFRWFFDNYDYDWATVHKAAELYCIDREDVSWQYTINNTYFIRKGEQDKSWKSELSNWCQGVMDGSDEPPESHFKENVF